MAEIEKGYNLMQVSELLGVKIRTIREWIKTEKIHAEKIAGTNRWIVFESEIKRLQNKQEKN